MDLVTLGGAIIEMSGAIVVTYLLRKQRRRNAIGLGGSMLLLGLTLLGMAYDLISGIIVWIPAALSLILFVSFFYLILRKPHSPHPYSEPTKEG